MSAKIEVPDRDAIDEDFVRRLLREQHPDLADSAVRRVPGGWGNQLWRIGDGLAARLPMTEGAPRLLDKEFRWLPEIGPRLALPVPIPLRRSRPTDLFPRSWTITTWVPGTPADRAELSDVSTTAANLAAFLRTLHQPAPPDAPANPGRSGALPSLTDRFRSSLAEISDLVDTDSIRRVWDDAADAPDWPGPPLWIHADLHPANTVVTDGVISGIVDFGELCAGDPAVDLSAAWRLLPEAHTELFDAYGGVDQATIRRARGWALIAVYLYLSVGRAWERGLPGGQPGWSRIGHRMLKRILA